MKIIINDDFDLYKIAYSGQCFRVRELDDNTFFFVTGEHTVTIRDVTNTAKRGTKFPAGIGCADVQAGTKGADTACILEVSCTQAEWDNIWFHYFDLETDYSKIRKEIPKNDKYLAACADVGRGIRILNQDKFETLISFIISQRKSIPAIKKCVESISQKYGKSAGISSIDASELFYFPTPKDMFNASAEELASCGLGYRLSYVEEAARRVTLNEVNLDEFDNLSDEELVAKLKGFYGVGDKVANCVALFAYHRVGLAPIDTWIKKIIDNEYGGVSPFPGYGKYAGIMQQYMFYAAQHMKMQA